MPDFTPGDVSKITVEKLVSDIDEAVVDEQLKRLAENMRSFTARAEGEAAQSGDQTVIDFLGSIDGVPFEGGAGNDFNLTLGSGQFIPGFEDQLVGAKAGDKVDVKVAFPAEYHAPELAGKDAVFAVTVKEVKAPGEAVISDETAKNLGLPDLATLRERIRDQIKSEYGQASRMHLKRRILDALDNMHDFGLPPAMVEAEFTAIWAQVEAELAR
jgi:trigger factor